MSHHYSTAFGLAIAALTFYAVAASAYEGPPPPNGGNWPVYQRKAFERHHQGPYQKFRYPYPYVQPPSVSSGWFQRPYPYHLDYYRMKYGGSYAPYFGNLYGPPNVYAPAYGYGYSGYGDPYGGYGYPPGYGYGGYPMPGAMAYPQAAEPAAPANPAPLGEGGPVLGEGMPSTPPQ